MKPKLLHRIAAIAMIVHDLGHTFGGVMHWKDATEPAKQEVIRQMTTAKFDFMGSVRSFGEFYEGFGFAASLAMLFFAVVLWLISGDAQSTLAKKILVSLFIILTGWWTIEFIYFFPFAAINTMVAWLSIGIALTQMRRATP